MKHYRAAGLGSQYNGCCLHNCIVMAKAGKPWKGVNTKEAKRAKYILESVMWQGHRLLEKWYSRKMAELREAYMNQRLQCNS